MSALSTVLPGPLAGRLGWVLVHFVWQGAAVAGAAAIVLGAMRRRSAAARYLVAVGALGLLAAAPLVTFLAGGGGPDRESAGQLAPRRASPSPRPIVVVTARPDASEAGHGVLAGGPSRAEAGPNRADAGAGHEASWSAAGAGLLRQGSAWLGGHLAAVVSLYLAGVSLLLLWRGMGLVQVGRLVRGRLAEAPADVRARAAELARRLGVSRPVRVLLSARVAAPTLVGALRSAILLPTAMLAGLAPRQVDAILAHELAHVRRWDFLVNAFQVLVETLLFYHPGVWWLSRRVRAEREDCCDDLAVSVCGDRLVYARALASLADLPTPAAPALAAGGGSLLARIRRIVGVAPRERPMRSWAVLAPSALAAGALVAAGCLALGAGPEAGAAAGEGKPAVPAPDAGQVVRVHDVRDIAMKVPDFTPPKLGWSVLNAAADKTPAGKPPVKEEKFPSGDPRRLAGIVRLVRESVAPLSWESAGGRGRIVTMSGQLLVQAAPGVQVQVADLLAQLRKKRPVLMAVESRLIEAGVQADGKLRAWLAKNAAPRAGESGLLLTAKTAEGFLKVVQAEPAASVLSAPRVTVFAGQQAYITVGQEEVRALPLGTDSKAVPATHSGGVVLGLRCVASPDRKRVSLLYDATVAELAKPAGCVESHRAHGRATRSLPIGRTILVRLATKRYRPVGLKEIPAARGRPMRHEIVEQAVGQDKPAKYVYILITPRVVTDKADTQPATRPAGG